jgi:hypothetical protein
MWQNSTHRALQEVAPYSLIGQRVIIDDRLP